MMAARRMKRRDLLLRVGVYGGALLGAAFVALYGGDVARLLGVGGAQTVASVLARTQPRVEAKYRPRLPSWPPRRLELVAFKAERVLEVWAGDDDLVRVAVFPIRAASGRLGPKAREGDLQVPEGVYGLPSLNPNSSFHLSLFVDYPNAADVARSKVPRAQMGGEIFVHGRAASVGCIAIGDEPIEDVFTLAALVAPAQRRIVIAPYDFRRPPSPPPTLPTVPGLYEQLRAEVGRYPVEGRQR